MSNNFIKLHQFTFTVPAEDIVGTVTIPQLFTYGTVEDIIVNTNDIIFFHEDNTFPLTILALYGLHTIYVTENVDHIFKILNNYITLESGGHEL